MTIRPIHILLVGLLGFGLGSLLRSCDINQRKIEIIDPQVTELRLNFKLKEKEVTSLRDTINRIRSEEKQLLEIKLKAESRALSAERKYAQFRWIKPKDKDQQIEFLQRDTTLCDSALIAAKIVAMSIANELKKSQDENYALDTLTMNLNEQKAILLKTDSLRDSKEQELNKIIKRNKIRRWFDRLTGAVVIYLLALL